MFTMILLSMIISPSSHLPIPNIIADVSRDDDQIANIMLGEFRILP